MGFLTRSLAALSGYRFSSVVLAAMPGTSAQEYYRADGVRIHHDPYGAGMAEKYGTPGQTDNEGFDPYADSVGPGIYGGIVKRDPRTGEVLVGQQYQNHNPRPGPIYAGGGYTPMSNALRKGRAALKPLLDKFPDLVNEVSTGGARPLHMCGMGQDNQHSTAYLIQRGADVEALDTYGMTPLHRMASNNLAIGAAALLAAGADPENQGKIGTSPMQMAMESRAQGVVDVLNKHKGHLQQYEMKVAGSGVDSVNQLYKSRDPLVIPLGFSLTCAEMNWDSEKMWLQLSDQKTPWFEAANGAYIYWNQGDGKWWIDAPDGKGVYIAKAPNTALPVGGWQPLPGAAQPLPRIELLNSEQSFRAGGAARRPEL